MVRCLGLVWVASLLLQSGSFSLPGSCSVKLSRKVSKKPSGKGPQNQTRPTLIHEASLDSILCALERPWKRLAIVTKWIFDEGLHSKCVEAFSRDSRGAKDVLFRAPVGSSLGLLGAGHGRRLFLSQVSLLCDVIDPGSLISFLSGFLSFFLSLKASLHVWSLSWCPPPGRPQS